MLRNQNKGSFSGFHEKSHQELVLVWMETRTRKQSLLSDLFASRFIMPELFGKHTPNSQIILKIRYNANNFLVKNKDPLNDSAVSVLKTASNQLTLEIFADYVTQEEAAELAKTGATSECLHCCRLISKHLRQEKGQGCLLHDCLHVGLFVNRKKLCFPGCTVSR